MNEEIAEVTGSKNVKIKQEVLNGDGKGASQNKCARFMTMDR